MSADIVENRVVTPGEVITDDLQYMRGHGTFTKGETLRSSVLGTIERVNKLISVHPFRNRYSPEIGDVVVGRVLEVGIKRWRVDVKSRLDAALLLSSVNLPGGVQRRKLESDELQMRSFFSEGDMLVAEVQQFFGDGSMSLHTRNLKYGKLRNGMLVQVPPSLIRRSKSHFCTLPIGVDVILGVNGMIWVCKHTRELTQDEAESHPDALYSNENETLSKDLLESIARLCNCIRIMCLHSVSIFDLILMAVYDASLAFPVKSLLDKNVSTEVLTLARHQLDSDMQM